jgi:tellurium resistance protein TerZ
MDDVTAGQEIALGTSRLTMGVSWDKDPRAGFIASGKPDYDLDASVLQFAGDQLFDLAFFNNLVTRDGAVVHQGDNLSGSGEGDDEQIVVDLGRVYAKVDSLFLVVTSFQGHSLQWVDNAFCRLTDDDGRELARLRLVLDVDQPGVVMARLSRDLADPAAGWRLRALGTGIPATDPTKAVPALRAFL